MNNDIGKKVRFESKDTINWLRSADRALLVQGWQEIAFMNPVNVVFVYLLVRDTLLHSGTVACHSVYELQCIIMSCLYLAYSYMGNEISYPLKPFLIEENRSIFWQRICDLMSKLSSNMLRINRDPRFFTELFYELKSFTLIRKSSTASTFSVSSSQHRLLAIRKSEQQDAQADLARKHPNKYLNYSSQNLSRITDPNVSIYSKKYHQNFNLNKRQHQQQNRTDILASHGGNNVSVKSKSCFNQANDRYSLNEAPLPSIYAYCI
jgi:hypothetical protein